MFSRWRWIIIAIVLLIALPWGGYHLLVRSHRLSLVPEAMGVSTILYASEQSRGFGPGGNETGIIVYEMPKAAVAGLQANGIGYLEKLPQQSAGDWRGRYSNWQPTPVASDPPWPRSLAAIHAEWTSPGIGDYLFRYGFLIPLDRDIERMVNEAILSPGSYYAYGRVGMIIVIPAAHRIVYAYSG